MPVEIKGCDLTREQRKAIEKMFPFRWTTENRSRVEKWLYDYEVQKAPPRSDDDWIKEHKFFLHPDGHFSEYAEPIIQE